MCCKKKIFGSDEKPCVNAKRPYLWFPNLIFRRKDVATNVELEIWDRWTGRSSRCDSSVLCCRTLAWWPRAASSVPQANHGTKRVSPNGGDVRSLKWIPVWYSRDCGTPYRSRTLADSQPLNLSAETPGKWSGHASVDAIVGAEMTNQFRRRTNAIGNRGKL